jgi:hypothetical protein
VCVCRPTMCDLQQRAAIGKWSTVMRTLSAEWSCWAVQVCACVRVCVCVCRCVCVLRVRAHSLEYHKIHDVHAVCLFPLGLVLCERTSRSAGRSRRMRIAAAAVCS